MNQNLMTLRFELDGIKKSRRLEGLGLTNVEWEVFKATPLYNFKYDGEQIMNYCRALAGILQKEDVLEIAQLEDIEVSIEILSATALNSRDPPGLKLSVEGKVLDNGIMTVVECFTGFLLSIDRKKEISESEILCADGVILPLFLAKYTHEVFVDGITNFLKLYFGSVVHQLEFQPLHLKWILTLWSYPENKNPNAVFLSYESPDTALSEIQLFLDKKALSDLWILAVKSNDADEIDDEQVFEFSTLLEEMFFKMFEIHLVDFKLSMITLPKITVQSRCSISFSMCSELYWFLKLMTKFCQELILI